MNKRRYSFCMGLITAAFFIVIVWSAFTESSIFLPLIAGIAAAVLIFLCKRQTDEVLEDERSLKITRIASWDALKVFLISAVAIASSLIAFGDKHPGWDSAGNVLSYAVCAQLLIYLGFYIYYGRKYGDSGG
jgi:uncharacterized membrane protein